MTSVFNILKEWMSGEAGGKPVANTHKEYESTRESEITASQKGKCSVEAKSTLATADTALHAKVYSSLIDEARLNPSDVGVHQANAILNLSFNIKHKPCPILFYEFPRIYGLPFTDFYRNHRQQIINELEEQLTSDWLQNLGQEKLNLYNNILTNKERDKCQLVSNSISYYSKERLAQTNGLGGWSHIPGIAILWQDGRRVTNKYLSDTSDDVLVRTKERLEKLRQKAQSTKAPRAIEEFEKYERYLQSEQFKKVLKDKGSRSRVKADSAYLEKMNTTHDFNSEVFRICRHAENTVRELKGLPKVGEGWISETQLYNRVKELLPGQDVIQHGRPAWLGRQHFDIWIPSLSIAIEYHGEQHYQAVSRFGGEESVEKTMARDDKKRQLCKQNKVSLIEIRFDEDKSDEDLLALLSFSTSR